MLSLVLCLPRLLRFLFLCLRPLECCLPGPEVPIALVPQVLQDLLPLIWPSHPAAILSGTTVVEPASHVPASVSWVVVTPVVFIIILALRLAPIHAIQAQPVKILSGSSTSFFDNIVEALVTARKRRSARGGRRRVREL